jgi:hypothetical protein
MGTAAAPKRVVIASSPRLPDHSRLPELPLPPPSRRPDPDLHDVRPAPGCRSHYRSLVERDPGGEFPKIDLPKQLTRYESSSDLTQTSQEGEGGVHARYALLGSRSVLDSRRPSQCGRAVPVGPPLALALAAIPIRTVAAQASPRHRRSRLKLRLVSVARGWVSTKYTARRPPPMYVELRTPGVPQAETPVLRPIVSRNVPDAIHNSDQSPGQLVQEAPKRMEISIGVLRASKWGWDTRGLRASGWGKAKAGSPGAWELRSYEEADTPSTGELQDCPECACPTGDRHGRTTRVPAQRRGGAKGRSRSKRMGLERGQQLWAL